MKNTFDYRDCYCPHCETELKKGCLSPEFCKPCHVNKRNSDVKVCPVCKSEYVHEYSKCPACSVREKR